MRAGVATAGLLSASAILVHFSGGLIEMHFHFVVMVPLVALYQDWGPFSVGIGYVLLHHGITGAVDPASVYNHPAALAGPWRWAGVHAVFIAAVSVVCLVTWRMNEKALEHSHAVEDELRHERCGGCPRRCSRPATTPPWPMSGTSSPTPTPSGPRSASCAPR